MPTYVYACTECGHQFEQVQSFSDASLTECPNCAGKLRKVFNSVGIVFKGSGFYRNDSREKSTSGAGSSTSETKSEKSEKSGSETKSESKSESKSDSSTSSAPAKKESSSSTSSSSSSSNSAA